MTFPTLSRLDVTSRLTNEYGKPVVLLPWLRELLVHIDDPDTFEYILSLVRQAGKTTGVSVLAETELLTTAGSYTILLAASESQQQAVFARKLKAPLERFLDAHDLRGEARFTKNGVAIPALNSEIVVLATNESTVPGRTPTKLLIDEARDVPTAVFSALAPSVIGASGKIVIASTAGRPSGWFYDLVKNPTPSTWIYASSENENPHASRGVLDFLQKRLALVAPSAARRELANEFTDDADAFLPGALIDDAVDDSLSGSMTSSDEDAWGFLDLSRKRDLTSLVVVLRQAARRPEAADHLVVALVQTWDPAQSPTQEVDFAEVRAVLATLPRRFPGLDVGSLLIDEGAEASSILPWARAHAELSLIVNGFRGTPVTNMSLWSALAARLHARTISIPRHERLLSELRNLRQESFAFGASYRIVDGSRRLHRDVSLALAGACMAAGSGEDNEPLSLMVPGEGSHVPLGELSDDSVNEASEEAANGETVENQDGDDAVEAEDEIPEAGERWSALTSWRRATRNVVDGMRQRRALRAGVKDAEAIAARRVRDAERRQAEEVARRRRAEQEEAEQRRLQEERRQAGIRIVERAIRRNGSFFPSDWSG